MAEEFMIPSNDKTYTIYVCQGTGCVSSKSDKIRAALEESAKRLQLENLKIDITGCHGLC
jgi:NADH:ubiquinone oxidoreductase subunit E